MSDHRKAGVPTTTPKARHERLNMLAATEMAKTQPDQQVLLWLASPWRAARHTKFRRGPARDAHTLVFSGQGRWTDWKQDARSLCLRSFCWTEGAGYRQKRKHLLGDSDGARPQKLLHSGNQ